MTPEQQELFDQHITWAHRFVYAKREFYWEALRNAALVGLWRAVMKFERGPTDFPAFAAVYVKGEIYDEWARSVNKPIGGRKSRIEYDDLDRIKLQGHVIEEVVCDLELKEWVETTILLHTPEEQFFLRELFLNEKTLLQIDVEQQKYPGWARYQFTKLFQGLLKIPWNREA